MADTKTPAKKGAKKKRVVDHAGIRREILLGQLSNSEIARQFGLSRPRIIQIRAEITKAQKDNLSAPVNCTESSVRTRVGELINQEVSEAEVVAEAAKLTPQLTPPHARAKELLTPLEPDEIESAAERVVKVVRDHRKDITSLRGLAQIMTGELVSNTYNNDLLQEIIEDVTKNDQDPRRRQALQRAVSLGERAGTLRSLAAVSKILIELERQAFSVDKYASDLGSRQRRITVVIQAELPEVPEYRHD